MRKKGILVIFLRHINYLSYNYLNEVTIRYNLGRLFPIQLWSPNVFGQILMIDQMGRVRKYKRLFRSLTLRPYISTKPKVTS
ncbi:hypothetical protein HanRHA438_Chr14g0637161 [Helianthus annuus]|nr:hypothetical protein HanRHA438_Chr14g0637161 [Helianthus annuus]